MRQRKVRNLEARMSSYTHNCLDFASWPRSQWADVFGNDNDVYLEIGSGKGSFLIKQAERHPKRNYVGIEGKQSVAFRALEKLEVAGLANVRFAWGYVADPKALFSEQEVAGIYLNFFDPWPKSGHAHRRLTHRNYLDGYFSILKEGGAIEIKTDNEALYEFTLSEVGGHGCFDIVEMSGDLHGSDLGAREVTSEYEEKFMAQGLKIRFVKLMPRKYPMNSQVDANPLLPNNTVTDDRYQYSG